MLALGLDHHAALALHSLYALGWLLALFMVTRRHGSFAKRLTLLALCSISLSPYAFAHDLMALVVPAAFLLRRARERGAFAWMDVAIPAVWVFSYFETIAIVPPPLAITLTAVLFMAMPDDGAAEPGGKARQRN